MGNRNKIQLSPNQRTRLKQTVSSLFGSGLLLAAMLTIKSGPNIVTSTEPGSGYALNFNGIDQYIDLGKESEFRITTDLTLSAWVKPDNFAGRPTIISQAGMGETGGENTLYELYFSGNNIGYSHEYQNGQNDDYIFTSYTFNPDEWYHITIVRESANKQVHLYVYGILRETFSYTKNPNGGGNSSLRIGGTENTDGSNFPGLIDEVSLWQVALDENTVKEWVTKKLSDNHPNVGDLVAYFPFDDGGSNTLMDHTLFKDGTLQNSPEWELSGVPIGDENISAYDSPSSLSLISEDGDIFSLENISGNPEAIHLYMVNGAPNTVDAPGGFKELETSRYWGVLMTGGSSPSYSVVYQFEYGNYSGNTDSIQLVSRPNNAVTSWTEKNGSVDTETKTITLNGQTGTEYMVGETGPSNLPVELIGFNAEKQKDQTVKITWETAWELNNDFFEVERSTDARNFASIGTIPGVGTTQEAQRYDFQDFTPSSKTLYYRLKQVDIDGTATLSNIVEVSLDEVQPYALRFANPLPKGGMIHLNVNEAQSLTAELLTISGQRAELIFSGRLDSGQQSQWTLKQKHASGVYVLRIMGPGIKVSEKIVLQ